MITIAVIGRASHGPADPVSDTTLAAAYEVGRGIGEAGAALVSGGTSGVMEAASRGARDVGGLTIGVLPGMDRGEANAFVDVALPTGLGTARNLIYPRGCDAVVMVGGGAGTLNELTIAYQAGTPVVIVGGSGGWADRIRSVLLEGRYLDERRTVEIEFAATGADAARRAFELAEAAAGAPSTRSDPTKRETHPPIR